MKTTWDHRADRAMPPRPRNGAGAAGMTNNRYQPHEPAPTPRYPWFGIRHSSAQRVAFLFALASGVGLAFLYRRYMQTNDIAPDSKMGYIFAIAGTALLLLVGLGYVIRKRLGRRWPGRLHTFLAWHMVGGILGLVLILMHAAGNFNPRSGTYALYGLIAVVASGIVGRVLDRFAPRLAASAALEAISASGEERMDDLEQELEYVADTERALRTSRAAREHGVPWDLAYYDLDPEVEDIPALLSQGVRSDTGPILNLAQPSDSHRILLAAERRQTTGNVMREAISIRAANRRERLHLQTIRVWRRIHTLLSLAALGLLAWHLEYAVTLLMGAH
ncbi:MAG TPA: hypothetical protein VH540_10480 [Ktedonobacterales bacterium]